MAILDFLFGSEDTSGQEAARESRDEAIRLVREGQQEARRNVIPLQKIFEQNLGAGTEAALGVLGQSIPGQMSTFQQGNVGAQNQLIGGSQQAMNAILGNPVSFGGMRPTEITYDTSWARQALPQMASAGQEAQNIASISDIYQTALGRRPEQEGLAYWLDQIRAGMPLSQVRDVVSGSPEAQQRQQAEQSSQLAQQLMAMGISPTSLFGGDTGGVGGSRSPATQEQGWREGLANTMRGLGMVGAATSPLGALGALASEVTGIQGLFDRLAGSIDRDGSGGANVGSDRGGLGGERGGRMGDGLRG